MSDTNSLLRDLGLSALALQELEMSGFSRIDDLKHLSNTDLLQINRVGGRSYKLIVAALRRKPWAIQKSSQKDRKAADE